MAADPDKSALRDLAKALAKAEEMLQFLPDGAAKNLVTKIGTLRGLLLEQRPPAFVLVGRRGAGKSSLVNALFGAEVAKVGHVRAETGRGTWYEHHAESGTLHLLDTRGLQEGSRPSQDDDKRDALSSVAVELKRRAPDAVLFVVRAQDVDSAIDADLTGLEEVLQAVERAHKFRPPVLGVLTHCDLFEPKRTRLHAPSEESEEALHEKLSYVNEAEGLLEKKLKSRGLLTQHVVGVRGVSAYLSFAKDGTVRDDERWNIDALCTLLYAHLPNAGRGAFVRLAQVRGLQEELAETLTQATAAVCAAVAAVPVPVADLVPITSLQVSLVVAIAWLSGRRVDTKSALELLASLGVNVGAAFALREGARALVKYVFPGGGSAISGAVAFAGTLAIGAAARAYYLRGEGLEGAKRAYAAGRNDSTRPE
jgi:predicted GTPase